MSSLKEKWTKIKQFGRKKKKDYETLGGADDETLRGAGGETLRGDGDETLGDVDDEGPFDWYRDLERHCYGDVSIAVAKGSVILEDHSQVESYGNIFYVGVYDGYAGPDASIYICENLYPHFLRGAERRNSVSDEVLGSAILATEEGFLSHVDQRKGLEPSIAIVGSCCLVGVIQREKLYVANLGDSRAVLGFLENERIVALQLTNIHKASEEEVRAEIMRSHPYGPRIVVETNGRWSIKGINKVSRAIGDTYLKNPDYFLSPLHPLSDLPEQLRQPVLTAEPNLVTRVLNRTDRFLIFASHGFWEHISNEEAVDFVHTNPPRGIARELLKKVLTGIAEKCELTYDELEKIEKHNRRALHDDITVVVVFIDSNRLCDKHIWVPRLSIRGFSGQSTKHEIEKGELSKQGGSSNQSGSSKHKDRASKPSKWIKNAWVTKTMRNDKGRSSKHEIEKGESSKQGGSLNQSVSSEQKDESSKKDRASKLSKWIKNAWVTKTIRNDKGK